MAKSRPQTIIVPKEVLEEMERVDSLSSVEKVDCLALILTYSYVNEEKTMFPSEPIYSPLFDEHERKLIKDKIMLLIERF